MLKIVNAGYFNFHFINTVTSEGYMHNDDYNYDSFDEELFYDRDEEFDPFENEDNEFNIDDLYEEDE